MKKINIILLLTFAGFVLTFLSCSNVAEQKQNEVCTIGGTLSVGDALPSDLLLTANRGNARSATSSFDITSEIIIRAYHCTEEEINGEITLTREEDYITGTANPETLKWSVDLNKTGQWQIEGLVFHPYDSDENAEAYILKGTMDFSLSKMYFNQLIDELQLLLLPKVGDEISGGINLEITSSVDEIVKVVYETEITGHENGYLQFEEGTCNLSFENVKAGNYEVTLSFVDSDEKVLYSCVESIPVFSGFVTDKWYGNSSYLQKDSDGNYLFVLTDDVIETYSKNAKPLPENTYPIILYDKFSAEKAEFEGQKYGFNIFTTMPSEGARLGDGITLAKDRKVFDFAIDDITQAIYTVEADVYGNGVKVVSYPSYGGYEFGKSLGNVVDTSLNEYQYARIVSLCANNGGLYAFVVNPVKKQYSASDDITFVIKKYENGIWENLSVCDEEYTTILDFDFYLYREAMEAITTSFPKIAVSNGYLYLTYCSNNILDEQYNTVKDYTFECYKFKIEESALKQVAVFERIVKDDGDADTLDLGIKPNRNAIDIEDIFVIPDTNKENIYILVSEKYGSGSGLATSGGLITLVSTQSENTHTLEVVNRGTEESPVYVFGCHRFGSGSIASYPSNPDSYFYGATKFVAKKPDELIIADEGCYDSGTNTNRLVKINLSTFAISGTTEVNFGFDCGGGDAGGGCKYFNYYNYN